MLPCPELLILLLIYYVMICSSFCLDLILTFFPSGMWERCIALSNGVSCGRALLLLNSSIREMSVCQMHLTEIFKLEIHTAPAAAVIRYVGSVCKIYL